MRWRKLGRTFDPRTHGLPEEAVGYAQAPQALVLEDRLRVFFSTRTVEPQNGKYVSLVASVDMSRDFQVLEVSKTPALGPGELGCFDEHGIFPLTLLPGDGELVGYTCGWSRRVSVSVETAIGRVVSRDGGRSFQRMGDGPVLAASLHEPFLVGDGSAKIIDGVYHMWYIFGTRWRRYGHEAEPERTYKIGHAMSKDGFQWKRPSEGQAIIPDRLSEDESQAMPAVVRIGPRYHMFFCYRYSHDFRNNPARGYRLGHARSDDLDQWVRDDEDPTWEASSGEWDSDMVCYPSVFEMDGRVFLLYNGNEFGRFGFGAAVLEE